MAPPPHDPVRASRLARWPVPRQWIALLLLSLVLGASLQALHMPAATLLGPMLAAIGLALAGARLTAPRRLFVPAQALVGVMMAGHLPLAVLPAVVADWPLLLAGTLATLSASTLLGWLMARSGSLPGTTAIWGSSPGAAAAMTLMAEAYGADVRLVAMMQYLRVLCCALAAMLATRYFHLDTGGFTPQAAAPLATPALLLSATVAACGLWAARRLRLPGGALLLPLALGLLVQLGSGLQLALPAPLLAASFALIGWSVGLRFSPEVLQDARRVLPMVLASILTLLLVNAGVALLLVVLAGVEPLTAFLATSPGGADSVAIITAAAPPGAVDTPFVMAMQILRFLVVVTAGPLLARWLSRRAGAG